MSCVKFSAHGARWGILVIKDPTVAAEYIPALPGTGLLFTSAEGEMRFLSLAPDAVPAEARLQGTPVEDLAMLVQMARRVPR